MPVIVKQQAWEQLDPVTPLYLISKVEMWDKVYLALGFSISCF